VWNQWVRGKRFLKIVVTRKIFMFERGRLLAFDSDGSGVSLHSIRASCGGGGCNQRGGICVARLEGVDPSQAEIHEIWKVMSLLRVWLKWFICI